MYIVDGAISKIPLCDSSNETTNFNVLFIKSDEDEGTCAVFITELKFICRPFPVGIMKCARNKIYNAQQRAVYSRSTLCDLPNFNVKLHHLSISYPGLSFLPCTIDDREKDACLLLFNFSAEIWFDQLW